MQEEVNFKKALAAFDQYNSKDPNQEILNGQAVPKELLYAQRMTQRLLLYKADSSAYLQLAARSQHIGRWEIARSSYPMDKKGYMQWRNKLKDHHASIAEPILKDCGYDELTIEKVKALLLKKNLTTNPDTQTLEDVICLVFLEYYIEEFAAKQADEKVIDILRKTIKKMSAKAIQSVAELPLPDKIKSMIHAAVDD
jgi:hypothetical protein